MIQKFITFALLSLLPLLIVNCSISQNAQPIPKGKKISTVYVKENTDNFESDFHSKLVNIIRSNGVAIESYKGSRPAKATYHLDYLVDTEWDMQVYLAHFQCNLYQGAKKIGSAEYDARKGGANFGKFGPPETKIKPVIDQMFGKAQPQ